MQLHINKIIRTLIQDERIVFDWAHTQTHYLMILNCVITFIKDCMKYTQNLYGKYQMLKNSEQHSPKGMSIQNPSPLSCLACRGYR